jgi:hypothetical protein
MDHRSLAEAALENTRRLQPDSGAVHQELALHALKISNNVEEAAIQVQLARLSLPNNAQVEAIAGRVVRYSNICNRNCTARRTELSTWAMGVPISMSCTTSTVTTAARWQFRRRSRLRGSRGEAR